MVFLCEQGPLLVTWGDRTPAPSPDYLFAIFPAKKEDQAMQFANEAKHQVRTGNGAGRSTVH